MFYVCSLVFSAASLHVDFELLTVLHNISEMSPSLEYWINYPSKCYISCAFTANVAPQVQEPN